MLNTQDLYSENAIAAGICWETIADLVQNEGKIFMLFASQISLLFVLLNIVFYLDDTHTIKKILLFLRQLNVFILKKIT